MTPVQLIYYIHKYLYLANAYILSVSIIKKYISSPRTGPKHLPTEITLQRRQCTIIDATCDMALEQDTADIPCSSLTGGCIRRGLNLKEGGAVYDFISGLQAGIANLADSPAAIKKVVFEDRHVTPEQLWEALMADFEGEQNEKIRALLKAAPKYGNDDEYVDQLVVNAYNVYIDKMKKYHNNRYVRGPIGGIYYAGFFNVLSINTRDDIIERTKQVI